MLTYKRAHRKGQICESAHAKSNNYKNIKFFICHKKTKKTTAVSTFP